MFLHRVFGASLICLPAYGAQFQIPPQSLDLALKEWSRQSGLQVFASRRLTQNRSSSLLDGEFSDEVSLQTLLVGSDLKYKKIREKVFVIIRKPALPSSSTPASDNNFVLEEVVITSRRRVENMQDSPVSVAAFTEIKLEQLGLSELPEIAQSVPNLVFVPSPPISGNPAATAVFLRGVGQLDFTINVDPGVGTYVDGVYMARSVGGIIDLIDLERIEVLRGPQGTLFGRNTIGGAVRLISKRPGSEAFSNLAMTLGSDQRTDLQGVFNVPLTDSLYSKTSLLSRQRDGYVTDGNGTALGDDNSLSIRSQLLWFSDSELEARLAMDWTRDRENGSANTALNLFSQGQFPDRVNRAPLGEATNTGCRPEILNSSRQCFGPAWIEQSQRRTASQFPANSDNDIYGWSLTLTQDQDWASLKSITAWRKLESEFQRDSDHTPFNLFATENTQNQHQFSQEFQVLTDSLDNTVHGLAGLYYFKESADEFTQIYIPDTQGRLINGLFDHDAQNRNWAAYGETTFDVDETLHLTLGARYTRERKRYASYQVTVDPSAPEQAIETLVDEPGQSLRFEEVTTRATLSLDWNPETMLYLTFSEGFKSGGFNARHLGPAPGLRAVAYAPEYVTQYEFGIKYTNRDSTLRINAAAFYSDYTDIQISTNPEFTRNATITQNAAEADISGMELEFTFSPTPYWLIEGGIGYLNAAYNALEDEVSIAINNDFAWVPEWSGNLALSYIYHLDSGASLIPRLGVSYKSDTEGTAENEADVRQSAYGLADLNVMYKDATQQWYMSFGLSNVTDEEYLVSANQNQAIGYAEGVYARGREWRVKIARHF